MENSAANHMIIGVLSDTHGVFDEALHQAFTGAKVKVLLHAGDVGHHGGHAEVLHAFKKTAPIIAVRGNVDEAASLDDLPEHKIVSLDGWRILITHIAGTPASPELVRLIREAQPDILVHGHSHRYGSEQREGVLHINPGSAGPARFRLPRTAALLELHPKILGIEPRIQRIDLPAKAPQRIPEATRHKPGGRKRKERL